MNEDDLLARLGTTRAATSTYESDVIRQATYKLAPPLTLDENSVGFPDLINTPLLPFPVQGQAKANRQVVIRVLSQLQRQLQQQCSSSFVANSEEIRLLAMKQQMLLSMLGKHSQKASIQKCWSDQEALEDTYKMTQAQSAMLAPTRKARVPMQQRKQIPGAAKVAQLTEKTARGSSKQNSNKKKQQKRKDWSDSEDSISSDEDNVMYEMNTSSRRRRQAGEQQRGNQGASSSSVKKPAAKAKPKRKQTPVIAAASNRRTTSQETQLVPATRKRTPVKSYAENSDNEEMEFEEEQDASSRVKQEDMIQTNTTTEEKEEAQEDSMEKQASVKQEENTSEQNNNVQTDNANSNKNSNNITCPLCQSTWEVTDSNQMDTELAEHMAQCQNSTARRSTRRATAQRVSRHPVSYKEEEEEDDDDTRFENVDDKEEEKQNTQNRRGKRPASATTTKKRSAKKKIKFSEEVADFDINDEEEEQNSDNDQKQPASELQDDELIFDDDIDKDEELETGPSTKPELSQPEAVDDYRLDDYEDRVDYWRLHGVQQMRDLSKLKAEGEVNPGATVLQGGLHIPAWMNDRLFGYQRTGVEWMWQLHQQEAGGCIGDAMGLGKTVQVSSFLGAMAASRKVRAVLIISPATMLRHWLSELAIWAPGLRRILLHSSGDTSGSSLDVAGRSIANQGPAILRNLRKWLKRARRDRVYERIDHCDGSDEDEEEGHFCGTGYAIITTYEHVRRNQDMYVDHPWSYVVLDEAQKIRNPNADVTLACKRLRTPHRLAMTGTPIQNDLKELWSLFDFVFPGRLGTLPAFEQEFADPIKRGGYSNASPVQVQLAFRCSLVLRDLIDPYLLRRQKSEVEEVNRMPGKTEHVLFCRLSKRQRRMYEAYLKSDIVSKIFKGSTLLFAAVTMLRKICNHPDLVLADPSDAALDSFIRNGCVPDQPIDSDGEDDDEDDEDTAIYDEGRLAQRSGKFEVLANILPLWKKQGHRVLIFCQWTKMLNIIQTFVRAQGWNFLRLDGKTNVASRQQLVDKFNADESFFGMLCTTRTGGVGLNLTGANRIILYDMDWNPQTDAQARERAWRFGQEKEVTVYRLCTAGTIEEKMYQRQIFKTALTNKVLHDPRQRRLFSQKDLHDLLTLQPDNGRAQAGSGGMVDTADRIAKADKSKKGDYYNTSRTEVSQDDGETLQCVLKSKGLAGVFDHNFVDPSASGNKAASVREMEDQAKRIAKEAAKALRESILDTQDEEDPFAPTWTGANDSRFGGARPTATAARANDTTTARGTRAVSAGVKGSNTGPKSSGSLLASLREQNAAVKSGGRRRTSITGSDSGSSTGGGNKASNSKYTKLMVRIRNYVKNKSPTTDDLLDEFSNVPEEDAAVFRRLLNNVAKKGDDGRWMLQKEYF